jgi:hypothetical protein
MEYTFDAENESDDAGSQIPSHAEPKPVERIDDHVARDLDDVGHQFRYWCAWGDVCVEPLGNVADGGLDVSFMIRGVLNG